MRMKIVLGTLFSFVLLQPNTFCMNIICKDGVSGGGKSIVHYYGDDCFVSDDFENLNILIERFVQLVAKALFVEVTETSRYRDDVIEVFRKSTDVDVALKQFILEKTINLTENFWMKVSNFSNFIRDVSEKIAKNWIMTNSRRYSYSSEIDKDELCSVVRAVVLPVALEKLNAAVDRVDEMRGRCRLPVLVDLKSKVIGYRSVCRVISGESDLDVREYALEDCYSDDRLQTFSMEP